MNGANVPIVETHGSIFMF